MGEFRRTLADFTLAKNPYDDAISAYFDDAARWYESASHVRGRGFEFPHLHQPTMPDFTGVLRLDFGRARLKLRPLTITISAQVRVTSSITVEKDVCRKAFREVGFVAGSSA
jgi:hypothetical protein